MCDTSDISPSDLPDLSFGGKGERRERAERIGQRIFIAGLSEYGTRSQTIVIRSKKNVYYLYRETETYPDLPSFSLCVVPVKEEREREIEGEREREVEGERERETESINQTYVWKALSLSALSLAGFRLLTSLFSRS